MITMSLSLVGRSSAADAEPSSRTAAITGIVHAGGRPVAGVVVSDGDEVVATDAEGRYRLCSAKRNGYVFVSIPSGYDVPCDGIFPQFWQPLTEPSGTDERHDFALVERPNDRFLLLAVTDLHLARQTNDIEQLCTGFIPSVRRMAEAFSDRPVYSLNLGDSSWDSNWYAHDYGLDEYKRTMNIVGYPSPMFHLMGNHDNDGATAFGDSTDFEAAAPFRRHIGPNYYSFNIGQVHFVVLDDIVYINTPTDAPKAEGIVGKRNFEARVTADQLAWLRRDLAAVEDRTAPVVLATHAPMFRYEGIGDRVEGCLTAPGDSDEVMACFEGFTDIHILTGHAHANNTTRVREGLIEHNIGAVCGALWRTGAAGFRQIELDGSPCGYTVFEIDGRRMTWRYETIESGDRQFRTYDMNEVARYYRTSDEAAEFLRRYPMRHDFRTYILCRIFFRMPLRYQRLSAHILTFPHRQ